MIVLKDPGEDGNPPGERPNLDERFDMDDDEPQRPVDRTAQQYRPKGFSHV